MCATIDHDIASLAYQENMLFFPSSLNVNTGNFYSVEEFKKICDQFDDSLTMRRKWTLRSKLITDKYMGGWLTKEQYFLLIAWSDGLNIK